MKKKTIILLILASNLAVALMVFLLADHLRHTRPLVWVYEKISGQHQLVPVTDESGEILYWTCTMHPSVRMQEPGKCPLCGMDLTPVRKEPQATEIQADTGIAAGAVADPEDEEPPLEDGSVFTIDPSRLQLINVQTTPLEVRALQKIIRTVGTLALDERQIYHVHPRISGWIQEVFVDFEHQHVRKGDPLFTVYSPELVATQEEFLLALKTVEELSASPFENVSGGARSLLTAARRRLELFDLTPEQIQALEKSRRAITAVTLYAPVTGNVFQRNAYQNQYVTPESNVYTLADHSRIWALVSIYENEIQWVRLGQPVSMTTPAYPGQVFRGRITFVNPHLEAQTRTLQVRLEFENSDFRLKPDMYIQAEIHSSQGKSLAVPFDAVLRTGTRDLVFVEKGEGRFQLRQVELGMKLGNYYEVLGGLAADERVVSSANFLIDAESKVRGVESSWETPEPATHRH